MNWSSAEVHREHSEFELAKLGLEKATLVDAPLVKGAPPESSHGFAVREHRS